MCLQAKAKRKLCLAKPIETGFESSSMVMFILWGEFFRFNFFLNNSYFAAVRNQNDYFIIRNKMIVKKVDCVITNQCRYAMSSFTRRLVSHAALSLSLCNVVFYEKAGDELCRVISVVIQCRLLSDGWWRAMPLLGTNWRIFSSWPAAWLRGSSTYTSTKVRV